MMDWAIETGIAVSLLIVLVLIIRRPFARIFGARAAYALWLLPFIRLIMPEVTIPRIFPQNIPVPQTSLPAEIAITPEMISVIEAEPSLMIQAQPYILPVFLALWAIGAAVFFLYHWLGQGAFMDRLTSASEPAARLSGEAVSAAQVIGLKRAPKIRISDENAGPLVIGFFRPVVILPDNFITAFSAQQRHYALMHEFMHIKRGDIWAALAWLGFRAVNWPNPLVHYAARAFRSDQEAACDASVLAVTGDTQEVTAAYAETLIHAAKAATQTAIKTSGRASPQSGALALTIHHPLKERLMILGSRRKTNWRTRTAAAVMIIGAATLSAPLIQADAHPEEELAGKAENQTSRSIIKRMTDRDGKKVSEHFEINIEGDDVKAFKIDPSGQRIRIDVADIEGVDVGDIKSSMKRNFTVSDGNSLKIMDKKAFKKWAEKEYPDWKENDFAKWVEGDFAAWAEDFKKGKLVMRSEDGETRFEFNETPGFPKPPTPPRFSSRAEGVITFESDDLEGLEGLEALESLKSLESLEGLKGLEGLAALEKLRGLQGLEGLAKLEALKDLSEIDSVQSFSFSSEGQDPIKLKMRMTESKLAAARAMLEGTQIDIKNDSRDMVKAKRELKKARKALRAAEQALRDAE